MSKQQPTTAQEQREADANVALEIARIIETHTGEYKQESFRAENQKIFMCRKHVFSLAKKLSLRS